MSHSNSPMNDSPNNNNNGGTNGDITNNNNHNASLMNTNNALSAATLSALIPQPVLSSHTLANIHVNFYLLNDS